MKSVIAWVVVNLFLGSICIVCSALVLALFVLGKQFVPQLMDQPLFVTPLGLLGIAGGIWMAYLAVRTINARPRQGRARARA